ncbi:MAG: hypothetical protein WC964_02715 [Acholeplasmataceae bacterium]
MDYFWRNKGFTYDSSIDYFLSQYHLILIGSLMIISLLLWLLIRKLSQPKQRLMFRIIGVLLLILEVLRFINFLEYFSRNWFGSIGFHLCSFGVYITILAAIFQKKWLFDALLIFAIIGAPLAVIMPMGILPWYNAYSFLPLQSFLSHALITWVFVIGQQLKLWQPNSKSYWISATAIIFAYVVATIASFINHNYPTGGHDNFIWTRYVDASFPVISNWPYPYYLIFMFVLMIVIGFLYIFVSNKIQQKKASKSNTLLVQK